MSLLPLDDRILVAFSDLGVAKLSRGGLHIPDTAKVFKHRQLRKGEVIAVGKRVAPDRVKVGDHVAFLNQAGYDVPSWPGHEHREGTLRMLREKELEMVCEPEDDIEGRHVEPEDDQQWWQKAWLKGHEPSNDDVRGDD
jgi:co-chaperonin GroES (HSP10)